MTDPEQLLAELADAEDRLADVERDAHQVRDGMNAARVTERSVDGGIGVTVDSRGNVVDLRLSDTAGRDLTGAELSAEIMRLMRRAQSKLADALRDAIPSTVSTTLLDELTTQYATAYPAPPEDDTAPGPRKTLRFGAEEPEPEPAQLAQARPARPRREPAEDDHDYSNRGLLR